MHTSPARVTKTDALLLARRHEAAAERAATPVERAERLRRARYWRQRARAAVSAHGREAIPSNFHAYTHDARGALVRLG